MTKSKIIQVRMTPKLEAKLTIKAERIGLHITEYIRFILINDTLN